MGDRQNYTSPLALVKALETAPSVTHEFNSELELERFRRLLYSINGQGNLQFRTRRIYPRGAGPTIEIVRLR